MSRTTLRVTLAVAAFALWPLAEASALMITINSVTKNAGNTADYVNNNSTNDGEWLSATSIVSSGAFTPDVLSASVSGKSRYAAVLGSDVQAANFASRTDNATTNYKVVFTVTPQFAATGYSVQIDTARIGALVVRNEGGAAATAQLNAVTGTLSNAFLGTLNLPGLAQLNSNSTAVVPFNQTATAMITDQCLYGTQTFTLDFTWTQTTSGGNNVLNGSDEGVVLLGLVGTNPDFGASDDYPGTSGRTNQAGDGHFATISATVMCIPEPASVVLTAMGGIGLVLAGWRRRRIA